MRLTKHSSALGKGEHSRHSIAGPRRECHGRRIGDIGSALEAGLHGVLVRTGKFRPADLDRDIEPTAVLESIVDLPRWVAASYGGGYRGRCWASTDDDVDGDGGNGGD